MKLYWFCMGQTAGNPPLIMLDNEHIRYRNTLETIPGYDRAVERDEDKRPVTIKPKKQFYTNPNPLYDPRHQTPTDVYDVAFLADNLHDSIVVDLFDDGYEVIDDEDLVRLYPEAVQEQVERVENKDVKTGFLQRSIDYLNGYDRSKDHEAKARRITRDIGDHRVVVAGKDVEDVAAYYEDLKDSESLLSPPAPTGQVIKEGQKPPSRPKADIKTEFQD